MAVQLQSKHMFSSRYENPSSSLYLNIQIFSNNLLIISHLVLETFFPAVVAMGTAETAAAAAPADGDPGRAHA